jgi:hypothetical protein
MRRILQGVLISAPASNIAIRLWDGTVWKPEAGEPTRCTLDSAREVHLLDLDDTARFERMINLTVDVLIDTSGPETAGAGSVSR